MIIDAILLSGWMPFAEEIRLDLPAGPIAIVGSHAGDTRRSNRAGKTALLEAVTWCLFGVHRKRTDDAIINRSCNECSVLLEIESMSVARSRARGHSTRFRVDIGVDHWQGEAAQQELERRIGLSLDDYLATSCFRQGEVDAIVQRTAGERLALVSEWLQQSAWLAAKKIQAQKTQAVDEILAVKRGELNGIKENILSLGDALVLKNELELLALDVDKLNSRSARVHDEMFKRIEVKQQMGWIIDVKSLRQRATQLRDKLTGRKVAVAMVEAAQDEHDSSQVELRSAEAALAANSQVHAVGFDGQCPVMCSDCPAAQQVTEAVQAAVGLRDNLQASVGDIKRKSLAAYSKLSVVKRELVDYDRMTAEYQQVLQLGKELSAKIKLSEEEINAAPGSQPLQLELEQIRRDAAGKSQRIGQIESTLDASVEAERRHYALINAIEDVEDASRASHLALRAIASVPAKIAAQQLTELEQEANLLLASSGVSLRFSWTRELADKAPLCNDCGYAYPSKRGDSCPMCKAERGKKLAQELELLCDDGSGAEEDARFNSGGTRAIVGSAIRLAASAMLRRLRSSQAAWAVVDEPFGSLDAENREQLARTFAGLLGSVGFEQALVVSHDPALLAALPHRIVIDKDGVNSTARLE